MLSNAANLAMMEHISLLGRTGLLILLLGVIYFAYWRFHPSRKRSGRGRSKVDPTPTD
jgi:hypothetical protein